MDDGTYVLSKSSLSKEDIDLLINNAPYVTQCILHDCAATDDVVAHLCTFFIDNSTLEALELRWCKFTSAQMKRLMVAFEFSLVLEYFYIQDEDEDAYTDALVPYLLGNKGSILNLTLAYPFTADNVSRILEALKTNKTVTYVNFDQLSFDFDINTAINKLLDFNTTLTYITSSEDYNMTSEQQQERALKLRNNETRGQSLFSMLR